MDKRLFVEKKKPYHVEAQSLLQDFKTTLELETLQDVRVFNIYDIFGIDENIFETAKTTVFSEVMIDNIYEDISTWQNNKHFAVEYLPGQFDQRADSALQCLQLLGCDIDKTTIQSGKLFILEGEISPSELNKIKHYYINKIEMREKDLALFERFNDEINLEQEKYYEGFITLTSQALERFHHELGLAMKIEDLLAIQTYFKDEEKRNPSETEIKVFDTYWSDHCRHTTFETELTNIGFEQGKYTSFFQQVFADYQAMRAEYYGNKSNSRPITMMDMATIYGKVKRKRGELESLEVSEEINACSVYVDVDIDGANEKWIMQFKNETHNHPTEIEPFGGASTCIGGAIRDPLAGRTYVYSGVRVSGSGNPLERVQDTLAGKLPQKTITTKAAHGFSSYGNQIGLATPLVREIYDDGYKAKRLEAGLVVGAAPLKNIIRTQPINGDKVILLGGKTGRDGCGGATGSSKIHTVESLVKAAAEVQKGNPIVERKIQRLFRSPAATHLIKRCNDFGAGGVCVAIGELADGIEINLDLIPTKYQGLTGTELTISESQERMAVVVANTDVDKFIALAESENLEATVVANITDNQRLTMYFRGEKIVDLSRDFLATNGSRQKITAHITNPKIDAPFSKASINASLKQTIITTLSSLNVASQKGLAEMFDATIGSSTVLMPFGGKYQSTPCDVAVQKFPVGSHYTNTASVATFGYDVDIAKYSPFHGAVYAIVEALAKVVACGGDFRKVYFSFQEYFEQLKNQPEKWGKPVSALLGTLFAQKMFGLAAIGGKDSMSGSFQELDVPPTLIAFAVGTVDARQVISPEFKCAENALYLVLPKIAENDIPDISQLMYVYDAIHQKIAQNKIVSAQSLLRGGIGAAICKMSFGNRIGACIEFPEKELFASHYGGMILEVVGDLDLEGAIYLGKTTKEASITINKVKLPIVELEQYYTKTLEPVFPTQLPIEDKRVLDLKAITKSAQLKSLAKTASICAKPQVLIIAFPGTNCEYDTVRAFDFAGAKTKVIVFRNLNSKQIIASIHEIVAALNQSQILALPGGFSAGDEPDGSAKFIVNLLCNPQIEKAVHAFLKRDGLIIGICNGFQALVKSGLLPTGHISKVKSDAPTLTFNTIHRHVSRFVSTKVISNASPWMQDIALDSIHTIPVSHGEGRFIISEEEAKQLFENQQVVTQYIDMQGNPTMAFPDNPNGAFYAIEGIVSPDGHILGKMGHSERCDVGLHKNIGGQSIQRLFENGVNYFK